jgi:tRNA dimethylallyltransferase
MSKSNELIVIAGPTASGKTAKALDLAVKYGAEIFSADSRQLYKELNIGVAKPTTAELEIVKHHFINHISVSEHYDAGLYEEQVIEALNHYFKNNEKALLVGGTGLYIQAVIHGLDAFPPVDQAIIDDLNQAYLTNGLADLVEEIRIKDEITYKNIDLQNSRRVIRALSIIRASGQPFSKFKNGARKKRNFMVNYNYIDIDRQILYEKINLRVDNMVAAGLEDEVRNLISYKKYKALDSVGYKEFFNYFEGIYNYEEAIDKIKQHSRNYAKRQMTWFKAFKV